MLSAYFSKSPALLAIAASVCALALQGAHAGTAEKPREKVAGSTVSKVQKPRTTTQQVRSTERLTVSAPVRTAEPIPIRVGPSPRVTDALEELHHRIGLAIFGVPEAPPYLQQVSTPSVRVSVPDPFIRRPPMLPKIVTVDPGSTGSATGVPQSPAPALPETDSGQETKKQPLDEVVDFFRDSGDHQGSDKGLGNTFDPDFAPAIAPTAPSSSATYRRE